MDRFLAGSTADSLREADSAVTSLFGGEKADEDPTPIQHQRKRAKRSDCSPVRLTSLSADIAARYASYLASDDLLNLALTSKLYGAPASMRRGFWSLSEEVARQRYEAASVSEKCGVPRRGGRPLWLKLLNRLERHRVPLRFDHLLGSTVGTGKVGYVGGDLSSVVLCNVGSEGPGADCTAISNFVMSEGRHYALFHMNGIVHDHDDSDDQCIRVGIIRPVDVAGWGEGKRRHFWPFCQQTKRTVQRCAAHTTSSTGTALI